MAPRANSCAHPPLLLGYQISGPTMNPGPSAPPTASHFAFTAPAMLRIPAAGVHVASAP